MRKKNAEKLSYDWMLDEVGTHLGYDLQAKITHVILELEKQIAEAQEILERLDGAGSYTFADIRPALVALEGK